ncbi:hypothetical protein J5N97_016376 [Dioscorea zingiberensis]|uniref:CCHC-type domain-containing protein n=1 Tax=Dioscorea zingiberensis TaxID=325984 RepID=A0A9D5CJH1_9LILI|nr:hypothetical protein J5N97_016376 [Dioscorea zingiberensis]
MPNGFFMIRCSTETMAEDLLLNGPWIINGLVFHLLRWKEHFEPMYEKLTTATIWVHLINIPVEYWAPEHLEPLVSYFGRLVKVDNTTQHMGRAKFVRICIEIDLQKPLKRGVWVRTPKSRTFVSIIYEKLPLFCYRCGVIGHGVDACPEASPGYQRDAAGTESSPSNLKGKEVVTVDAEGSQRNTGDPEVQTEVPIPQR